MEQDKRFLKITEAAEYLGVTRRVFDTHIRPMLTEMKIGRSPRFEVVDLEEYIQEQKLKSKKPIKKFEERQKWEKRQRQDSIKEVNTGTLRKQYAESIFTKALEQLHS